MTKTHACCAAALAALMTTASGVASAQDTDIAFNASIASDYVFRGFSQTNEQPTLQAGVDLTTSAGFYGGAWISNVEFGDSTDYEIDVYGGYRTEVQGYGLDLGVVGYTYSNAPALPSGSYSYVEFKAAASRAVGPVTAGVAVYYSPDFFGVDEQATYVEGNLAFTPIDKITVSGAVGKQWLDVNTDYTTWNVGASYAFNEALIGDVRYHDADIDGPLSDGRAVVSLKVLF